MTGVRNAACALGALIFAAAASSAHAAQVFYVSSATTTAPSSQWQELTVGNLMSNVAATGILLTFGSNSPTDANQTVLTLCDDIYHDIYVPMTYTPELVYTAEQLSGNTFFNNGSGGTGILTSGQASLMGQLVTEAQAIYAGTGGTLYNGLNANDAIAAIQGAIWSIEYGVPVTDPGDGAVSTAITDYVGQYTAGSNAGVGLYSSSGTQNQVLGIGASPAPEPSEWALMIGGLVGLGLALRSSRGKGASKAA